MNYLRQSTAVNVQLGPFIDGGDFLTPREDLTIVQADCQVSKNAAGFGSKSGAGGGTHQLAGIYQVALDTTDTNTLGRLRVVVDQTPDALVSWDDFLVLPQIIYDNMISGGGLMTTINTIATKTSYIPTVKPISTFDESADTVMVGNNVTVGGLTTGALAQFFLTPTTQTYLDAAAESVVFETIAGSTGGGPTPAPTVVEIREEMDANSTRLADIQAKTDLIPADPATNTEVDTRLAAADYTAPDNAGIQAIEDTLAAGVTLLNPQGIPRATFYAGFTFPMFDETTGELLEGLTVTGTIIKDGTGTATTLTFAPYELEGGLYAVDLSSLDTGVNRSFTLIFEATGAKNTVIVVPVVRP